MARLGVFACCLAQVGACACHGPTPSSTVRQALPGSPLLSEVAVDPPEGDSSLAFIEVLGPSGNSLDGFHVVAVEGGSNGHPGRLNLSLDLGQACNGECSVGQNGLFLMAAAAGVTASDPTTTTGSALEGIEMENGSISVLLVECENGLPVTSVDPDDDGMLDLPPHCVLVDGLGWAVDRADRCYGACLPTQLAPAAATRLRGELTPLDAAAWHWGQLEAGERSWAYVGGGGLVTPGAENWGLDVGPSQGTSSGDVAGSTSGSGVLLGEAGLDSGNSGWQPSLVSSAGTVTAGAAGSRATAAALRRPSQASGCGLGRAASDGRASAATAAALVLLAGFRGRQRSRRSTDSESGLKSANT